MVSIFNYFSTAPKKTFQIYSNCTNTKPWFLSHLCPDHLLSLLQPPLVALLLLFQLHKGESSPERAPTYERRDPFTRKILTCDMCPPGTHMVAHCTANRPTECVPCAGEQFTELWNYLPRCIYCNNICYDNQEVELECSAKNDRVCRCKPGFYSTGDFCSRHSECGPGLGVKTNGTLHSEFLPQTYVGTRDSRHFKLHDVCYLCSIPLCANVMLDFAVLYLKTFKWSCNITSLALGGIKK